MEALFNEDWSLWGPLGEAALPWTEGAPLELEWLSKPVEGFADGTKPETGHAEDLWVPLVDLVNDADFEDWMEIKMDGEAFSSFLPESVDPFPPALAPSSPQGELLGPIDQQPEPEVAVVPRWNTANSASTDDVTTAVTSEAAILFSSMLEMTTTSSSIASPSSNTNELSPERPSSRDSSFSTDSSADSISQPPSVETKPDFLSSSFWSNNSEFVVTITESSASSAAAGESSTESTTSKSGGKNSRKSPRASSSRPKSARGTGDKKVRKRDQNRDAATRYREKKRVEADTLRHEEEKLERKNNDLRDRVDGLSSEIKYLKGLMKELLEARQKS